MSEEQESKPRTWVPLAAAAAVAGVVLIGAVGWSLLAGGPSEIEAAAIEACEAAYGETGGPAIVGGEVYETPEFADYYAVVETHGDVPVPLEDVTQETRDQWTQAAQRYEETGDGAVTVVWRLEGDAYRQCTLAVRGGEVDADAPMVTDLMIAGEDDQEA